MSKRLIVLAGLMVNLLVMMRPPLAAGQDAGGHPVLDPGFIPRLLPPSPTSPCASGSTKTSTTAPTPARRL